MKKKLLAATILVVTVGLVFFIQKHPRHKEYIHLKSIGSWGIDVDIWIYKDDSFFAKYSGESSKTWDGASTGLFQSTIDILDDKKLWNTSSKDLDREVEILTGSSGLMVVTDSNHGYLTVKTQSKILELDFYAASSKAKYYKNSPNLDAFSKIIRMVQKGTSKFK